MPLSASVVQQPALVELRPNRGGQAGGPSRAGPGLKRILPVPSKTASRMSNCSSEGRELTRRSSK